MVATKRGRRDGAHYPQKAESRRAWRRGDRDGDGADDAGVRGVVRGDTGDARGLARARGGPDARGGARDARRAVSRAIRERVVSDGTRRGCGRSRSRACLARVDRRRGRLREGRRRRDERPRVERVARRGRVHTRRRPGPRARVRAGDAPETTPGPTEGHAEGDERARPGRRHGRRVAAVAPRIGRRGPERPGADPAARAGGGRARGEETSGREPVVGG